MSMEDLIKKRNSLGYGSENTSRSATQKDLLDFRARIDKKISGRDDPLATVDVDYIDQYLNDHQQYWSGYGAGKDDAVNKNYRLDERRAAIDSWLSGSLADGTIDQEWYDQVSGLLSQADSSVGMYQGQRDAGAYMGDWRDWYNQSADALDGMDWSTGRGGSAFIDEAMAGFADRDSATRAWLEENRAMLGEEYYKSMLAELDSYGGYADELRAAYDRSAEYYSQWDSQDAFDRQNYLEDLNVDAMKAELAAMKAAYDDMYVLEGPYGLLANDLLSEEDRARHTMRYEDIQQAYGGNSEEILAKIEELEKDIRDAEKIQGGIAQAQKISGIEAKYSGMSYQDMMVAMDTAADPVEKAWLEQNAPAAMTDADYDIEIASTKDQAEAMANYIDVLKARYAELDTAIANYSASSDPEDAKRLTTAQRELDTLLRQLSAAEDDYDALMTRAWQLEQDRKYAFLDQREDFDEKSAVAQTEMTGGFGIGIGKNIWLGKGDAIYDYINFLDGTAEEHAERNQREGGTVYAGYDQMTDAERKKYNLLYNTEGRKAAMEYLRYLEPELDKRVSMAAQEEVIKLADQHPLFADALSVPLTLAGGAGYLNIAAQNAGRKLSKSYRPINYYSPMTNFTHLGNAITKTRVQNITDKHGVIDLDPEDHPYLAPILNGRGLADVYQLGMSALNSKVAALTGNPVLATTLLASSAATQGVLDALERGATDEQALTMGLWNGAFEAIFEFWEVNELLKGKPSWVKAAVNQAITEGVGEGLTDVANSIADVIIMADNSQIMADAQKYMDANPGMTENEAIWKAVGDAAIDAGWSMVGGAASGAMSVGGMAAGNAVMNRVQQYAAMPKTVKNSIKRLQGFGMDKDAATDISIALYQGAEGYGDQAAAYMAAFDPNQDPYTYASAFRQAYEIGRNNGNQEYLGKLSLNEDQRKIAYELGAAASRKAAQEATAPENSESDEERTYSVSDEGTTIDSTGKAVKVMGFTSVGDKAVLELEDGKTIDAKEVSFGTEDEAVLYETVAKVSGSAETANRIMKSYSSVAGEISASDFAAGLRQAYDLGVSGQVAERQLGTYELAGKLPAAARSAAFNRGKTVGDYKATARQSALEARGRQVKGQRQGQLHFDRKGRTFDSKRESSLKAMEALSKALGVNIYVYESYVKNGKRVYQDRTWAVESAPNGFYDKDGIHIDLNAGNFGQGTMMFTVAHELTHFIKEWSPVKFRKLADILVSRYAEQGTSVRELIDRQIAKAKENGREIDRDTAFEEVVADSMETMLTQGDIGDFMAQLKQKDKTLRDKIREWFRNLADSLKAVADEYRGAKPESPEGRLVAQMDDFVKVLQQAYAEALVEAGENYRANDGVSQRTLPKTEAGIEEVEVEQADRDLEADDASVKLSDRDAGAEKVAAALKRQNAKLKQDVKDLRELLSLQGKLTHGSEFTKSSIEEAMRSLIKAAGSRLNADDRLKMAGMLKDLYRYIAGDKELTWDGVEEKAGAIADLLMNNVNIKAQRDSYADDILGYIRGTKIKLSDGQRAEVEKLYGYENYRKMLFGAKVYIGRNGIDLDSLWHEASRPDMFGGTFKDDVNEGDQPAALLDIIENMREGDDSAAMEYAYNWESIRQGLIQSIYDRYWQLETLETVADKKKAQMDKLREDHRKLMDEIREDQKYTLEKLRTIRENVLYTVRTDYEKGSYAPVKLIAESWKTDRKRALGEFRQIEDTFIQMAKDFERFGQQQVNQRAKDQKGFDKAREQFEKALKKEAERHDKDNALWTREFERLLKEYDKSGRKIERLEERYKTREENLATGKQRAAVEKAANSLMDMLSKPSKEAHVPMALQAPLEKFLNSIDFSSKRALSGGELTIRDVAYTRALQDVKLAIAAQRTALEGNGDGTFSLDVPKEFLDQIDAHIKMIQDATEGLDLTANRVYEMTSDKLKDLAFILKTINRAIRDIDRLHMAGAKARVSELAKSTVWEMGRRKAVKTEDGGAAMWANYTPTFAFERMGTAATQILNGLKMGQAKLARTAAAVIKFSNETYTNKEVKAWENEVHEVELDSGETVKMTTAQIMSFYCLSRREQAKGHLTGGGIRMGNIGEGLKTIRQTDHFRLTQNDIAKINGLLTDRQIAVANKMQRYMADVGGRLGNEISMARWDYMEMTDRDYFPIRSDSDIHDARNPDQDKTNLWALLNKSFTKAVVKGANDAMIVSSIFDVFADHMSDMAEYNAFALPLVDAMKWYNYRESTKYESGHVKTVGVKKALTDKLGTAAAKYFIDLMTDINSSQKAGRYENFFGKLLSRSKAASVGWNLRVAIQQPTAILRASVYLDPMSLVKGTVKKGMKASIEEMKKYSGIALWKSLGYYDLNISRGIRDQIKGDTTVLDQINDAGMWLPGKMDEVTWSRIWESCKAQVRKEQKLSGERLLEETAKLFEDVVYHTQVADSVLTRSSLMRSKSQTVKELTSFMAEPTLSVNLLLNAFQDYREGVSKSDKVKRTMKILFCGYVLSAVANAVFQSFADAARDDDEYEGYWDKFFQALLGEKFYDGNLFAELNPLEKIVFVRDVLSLLQGYEGAKNPFVELAESGIKLVQNIVKFFQGKGSLTVYGLIYQSLQVLGGFTGAAPANLLREASTIWNWTFGKWNNMPLHRYKTDPKSQIRDAYKSGALKKSEAREALMAAGISVTDAYYIIKGWDAGESVGRYDDVYKAALAGDDISAAVAELVEHGNKTEKQVLSELRQQIKVWYTDPDSKTKITREQAQEMVDSYLGLEPEAGKALVEEWAFELEHGYSYDDIKFTYLDNQITEQEAKDVLMSRLGKTEAEADLRIQYWEYLRYHRDSKLTEYQVADYYEYAEPAEITADVYERYIEGVKGIEGQGTKVRKMAVIDQLPLTDEQKDALYFANDWAKSTLHEAPWHLTQ